MDEPKRYGIPGHCFDADGEPWHEPGECTAPECRKTPCCGFIDRPRPPHVPDDMAELYLNDAAFHYAINALAASSDPTTVLQLVSRIRDQIPAFTRRGE